MPARAWARRSRQRGGAAAQGLSLPIRPREAGRRTQGVRGGVSDVRTIRARGEESACHAGALGLTPGWGRSPGDGNGRPLQCPCLENPVDRGAWWAAVHGAAQSWIRLSDFHLTEGSLRKMSQRHPGSLCQPQGACRGWARQPCSGPPHLPTRTTPPGWTRPSAVPIRPFWLRGWGCPCLRCQPEAHTPPTPHLVLQR